MADQVTSAQLQAWEQEHRARIDRLTNLNGPECRDCSPEHPCQVLALIASHRSLAGRLAEAEEASQRLRAHVLKARFYPVHKPGEPDGVHWMYCADCGGRADRAEDVQHTRSCGTGAALAPGAGGKEEGS